MSRSTRSSARKSQDAPATEDGGLVQEGLSIQDSDKPQKAKGGEEHMDTSEANDAQQATAGGGESQTGSEGNVGGNEVQLTENGVAEDQKAGDGEQANEGKTEGQQSGEGGENQENKDKEGNERAEDGKEKKPKHPIVWVANVSRHVKATDLKQLFSQHGKVVTAKIVTNGRNLYGYVCLDTLEAVDVCVKNLNDTEFEGRKISVTVDKPVKDDKPHRRKEGFKDPLTTVYDESDKKSEKKDYKKKVDTSQMTVEELRKEVSLCEREIDRLRNRLIEEQSRARSVIKTNRRMERELGDVDARIREERKKYERDREESLKKNRLDHLRLDADRVLLEREKQELRRAREELERDLRRFIEDQQRASISRPRGGSPHPKRFRADNGPGEGGSSWISETVNPGPQRDSQGPGRGGGQFYNSWNNQGGGSGGGSQWRSMGSGSGGSGQPPFFRSGGQGGSFGGSGNEGGFRSPFDSVPNRKF